MSFKDSCITQLTPFSLTEESTRVPESNFPVYIGSGNTVMSVDSSGTTEYSRRLAVCHMRGICMWYLTE